MTKSNNVLIIAPHPDDEVIGCGGVIKKMSDAGESVFVLVLTRGAPTMYSDEKIENVRHEARSAHKILGVKESVFLDFYAPELDITPQAKISGEISNVIRKYDIDTLYIPHRGDIHHDHQAVFKASLVAARPTGNYSVVNIYAYETLSETEWAAPFADDAFIPTRFVNVEDTFSAKVEAMKCFKSQLRDFPNSRSIEAMAALASCRGSTVGFLKAEAFMHIRSIEK